MDSDSNYNEDIISQLIKFNIGTREEIIAAMKVVVNKNDINEIANFVMNNNEKKQINLFNNDNVIKHRCLCFMYICTQ